MTTQTRECVHSGVAQKTKRLQGQSNLNAWEEPRETHAPAQTNKTPTNQTPNTTDQNKIKKTTTHTPQNTLEQQNQNPQNTVYT
jgi:hypothetical protein